MENKTYISLGFQCTVPIVLKRSNLKKETLPFDWMLSSPKFVFEMLTMLLNNVEIDTIVREHFFNCNSRSLALHQDGKVVLEHYIKIDNVGVPLNEKYEVIFPHDSYDESNIQKYIRRFERLKDLMLKGNVTYLYISPSSSESGDFLIDGKRIITDRVDYLNKIYKLIKEKTSNDFEFKVILTENELGLDENIELVTIEPKSEWSLIIDECKTKL